MYPLNHLFMSKVEEVEGEVRKFSPVELRQVRDQLDDIVEKEMEFMPGLEHLIQHATRETAYGKSAHVRELRRS
jgi:hypothetical protein